MTDYYIKYVKKHLHEERGVVRRVNSHYVVTCRIFGTSLNEG